MDDQYFDVDYKVQTKLCFKTFDPQKKGSAVNVLIYGAKLRKVSRWGKRVHTCFFYILEEDDGILQWLSSKKLFQKSRLDLRRLAHVYETVPENYENSHEFNQIKLLRLVMGDAKELVLLFDSAEEKDIWWQGLQIFVLQAIDRYTMGSPTNNLVDELFHYGDADSSMGLSYEEVKRLLQRMHIQFNNRYIKEYFQKYDANRNGQIEKHEFCVFVNDIMDKPEVKQIYQKYHDENAIEPGMTLQQLQKFFSIEQKQELSSQEIAVIAKNYGDSDEYISFITFVNILFSPHNTLINHQKLFQEHDMTQPLSNYYVNSSHNTYLLSNQLTGKSSIEAYINAFKGGVKCVELDCWDGTDGEPIVFHGHTLTSKIFFKDILKCVVQHGFQTSPYPVILSLEIHCCASQQITMATYLKMVLNQRLLIIPSDHSGYEYYPSPQLLMNKIIVKGVGNLMDLYGQNCGRSFQEVVVEDDYDFAEETAANKIESPKDLEGVPQSNHGSIVLVPEDQFEFNLIEDEITFAEHNLKHQVNDIQLELTSKIYTNFDDTNNKDFDNFKNYQLFLYTQNKSNNLQKTTSKKNHAFTGYINPQGQWVDQDQWVSNSNIKNNILSKQEIEAQIQDARYQKKQEQKIQAIEAPPIARQRTNSRPSRVIRQTPVKIIVQPDKVKSAPGKKVIVVQKTPIELARCLSLFSFKLTFEAKREVWLVTSLSETSLEVLVKMKEFALIKYHHRFFSRIYPKATRFDSSNYDPMPAFLVGSQIVALNYQTNDEHLLLNTTMFLNNQNQGYVLKPSFLTDEKVSTGKEDTQFYFHQFPKSVMKILINFISAQYLRPEDESHDKKVVDPYIEVYVKGCQIDEQYNLSKRCLPIKGNGFNPVFNFQVELLLRCPELAFIMMRVYTNNVMGDDRLGINMIQVPNLRTGYRVVPLLDKKLNIIENCYLFVHLECQDLP